MVITFAINNNRTKPTSIRIPGGIYVIHNFSLHLRSYGRKGHYIQWHQLISATFNDIFLSKNLTECPERMMDSSSCLICTGFLIFFSFSVFKESLCSQSSNQHEILRFSPENTRKQERLHGLHCGLTDDR